MPGFLEASGYDGTTRIDLGNGYFAEVKNCLSSAEKNRVDDLLGGKQRIDVGAQRTYADLNFSASRDEMVILSLTDWNLDDPDGTVWMLGEPTPGKDPFPANHPRRLNVGRLPAPVRDAIWAKCDELNAPRTGQDAAQFPGEGVGGTEDGDGTAA